MKGEGGGGEGGSYSRINRAHTYSHGQGCKLKFEAAVAS